MRYTIKIDYTTGDTFQTYETSEELGISWENLDVAKEALRRISELDKIESDNESIERGWAKFEKKKIEYVDPKTLKSYSPEYPEVCIMLPLDDGTEHRHSTFWRGYF